MEGRCSILHRGRVIECEYFSESTKLYLEFGIQEKMVDLTIVPTRRWIENIPQISYFPWNTLETSSETPKVMIPVAFDQYITLYFGTVELKNQFIETADTLCGYY